MQSDFFKNILQWQDITKQNLPPFVIYAGTQKLLKTHGSALPWNAIKEIMPI